MKKKILLIALPLLCLGIFGIEMKQTNGKVI